VVVAWSLAQNPSVSTKLRRCGAKGRKPSGQSGRGQKYNPAGRATGFNETVKRAFSGDFTRRISREKKSDRLFWELSG